MIVKLLNGGYLDTSSGAAFDVKNYSETEGFFDWTVRVQHPSVNRGIPSVLDHGYADADEAQAALDELLQDEAKVIQPPITDDEVAPGDTEVTAPDDGTTVKKGK
jgi:hypothetical protein